MAKCAACGKFLPTTGIVSCGVCLVYHRGYVAVPDGAPVSRDWTCPDCKRKIKTGVNSSTPVRGTGGGARDDHELVVSVPVPGHVVGAGDTALGQVAFQRELAGFMAELREFRKELSGERAARLVMAQQFGQLERRVEAVERAREMEAASRERQQTGGEKQDELERVVAGLRAELNDRDQDALLADLDIGGLPEEKGENPVHAVRVVATRLSVSLQEQDVVLVPGGRARRLVVQLAHRQLRDDLLRAARVRCTLAAGEQRVYVNERLTRQFSQLFHRVREECRKRGWRFSRTRRGRVYARRGEGQASFSIRTVTDLERVFAVDKADTFVSQTLESQ